MVYTQPTLRLQGTVAIVYTRRHCHTCADRHTHQCYVVRIQITNSIYHSLLTQGVDSTSINCVSLESTKHQHKRTPPTLWCRKFISAYHYYDRLRFTYNNTPSPGWIVYRTAHCGAAFLSEDTSWVAMDVIVDSSLAIPKGGRSVLRHRLEAPGLASTLQWATCTVLHPHAPHHTAFSHMHRAARTCTALHHTALICAVLHHTALKCTALHSHAPHCTQMHHAALTCTALCSHAPYCRTLLSRASNCIILH